MIAKDRIFKKGDVIVSGFGNVRLLVGETGSGKAGDGTEGVFYDAVTPYGAPAGTDMRYARHATEREKKHFFEILEANGLVYDAKSGTITITAGEDYVPEDAGNYRVRKSTKGPQPFKVLKKRVRPTKSQMRLLEEKVELLDEVISTHVKEKSELKDHLDEVKGCNEKMAKDLAILQEDNEKLKAKNTTLEQSNKLMEEELNRKNEACNSLADQLAEKNAALAKLMNRGFFARLFNLK